MITSAAWLAFPGHEAFFVRRDGPNYLIHIERKELARRLAAGEKLETIVTQECSSG